MAAMTMDQGNSGAEACPVPRFRHRDPRNWAALAVAVSTFLAAGVTLWLG